MNICSNTFHSQFGEDEWIFNNLNPPERGIFCEVGAFDGIQSSNTLAFEEAGWTGICIEPQPIMAAKCRVNRLAQTFQCAITHNPPSSPMGWQYFYVNPYDPGQSRLMNERTGIQTPTLRLEFLLCLIGMFELDLLSIDTEGSELEVWAGIGKIRPKTVIIEYLSGDGIDRSKEINERLTVDGYKQVHRTEANLIFVRA